MIKNYSLSSSNAKQWLRKHLWHPLLLVAVVFAGGFLLALFVAVFVTVGAIAFRHRCFAVVDACCWGCAAMVLPLLS